MIVKDSYAYWRLPSENARDMVRQVEALLASTPA